MAFQSKLHVLSLAGMISQSTYAGNINKCEGALSG